MVAIHGRARNTGTTHSLRHKVDAKITSVSTGLEELANNAHESHMIVVQKTSRRKWKSRSSAWAP
jgi:hypothetical protein